MLVMLCLNHTQELTVKITELSSGGKYLKQADIDAPKLWTIKDVKKENVAPPTEDPEWKGVMYFHEVEKGLVLNKVNLGRAQFTCKSDDTDEWTGHKIVVFVDPEVEFGGKIVGGVRLRAPKQQKEEERVPF